MKIFRNRCERFKSKAHGALHGHSTRLKIKLQPSRWSTQRERHINWIGDERVPRNAAIGSRSRFSEIF